MTKLRITIPKANIWHEIVSGQSVTIGREGGGAQISISDPTVSVSRMHLKVELQGGRILLTDTNSSNGVKVNGKLISTNSPTSVAASDNVSIGNYDLEMELQGAAQPAMAPPAGNANDYSKSNQSRKFLALVASKKRIRLGRSPENDIVIDPSDRTVGRWHAELYFENGKWWIRDLRSKNGVYINETMVREKAEVLESASIFICLHSFNLTEGYRDLREEVAIQAKTIEKKYSNGYIGLKEMNLEVPYSKFIAVMGPSGCGKSTLLKVLNGDSPASAGNVLIHGLDLVKHYNLLKKKIGYVPQDDIIHKELTVYQTMRYSAKLRLPQGTEDETIQNKIDSVLISLFDEEKTKAIYHKPVHSLSGGERKRLSIAVELLTDPSILFLDEPTSPLDPESIHEFLTKLNNLKENGTTIIMVTHKPEDLNYVDNVVFLGANGKHVYHGPRENILTYFKRKSIVEVYGLLSDSENSDAYYRLLYEDNLSAAGMKQASPELKTEKVDTFLYQLWWLTRRYFQIKLNDRGNVVLLFAQPLIIGALISVIFAEFQLGVIFLMAISAVWFGVSNAAKEIVSEQSIYKRERMFNLRINAYIVSKINVLAIFSLVQLFMFQSIIYFKFRYTAPEGFEEVYQQDFLSSFLFMAFLAISATLLGLLLSTLFSNAEKVMTVVPIALMPQIMLAGVITKIDNWGMEMLSFVTLGRWGTEGLARIQDDSLTPVDSADPHSLESVIAFVPTLEVDTMACTEDCLAISRIMNPDETEATAKSALAMLDYYDEKLVERGEIIGDMMDGLFENTMAIMALNAIVYVFVYVYLKKKDSI